MSNNGKVDYIGITKSFPGVGKINSITSVDELLKSYSILIAKNEAFKLAVKDSLGKNALADHPFKLEGIAFEIWKEEFIFCINTVKNKKQINKLN